MPQEQAIYSHGHHASVVNDHARRTVDSSAGFLIPHLKPSDQILDIGCGPGSITVGLAKLVPQGRVIGVDAVESVLEQARKLAESEGVANIEFAGADANALAYPDATFDVVFCHQVLQHVKDPVGVLREMRRVAKPGGIVAARDADYNSFAWFPAHVALDRWHAVYLQQARVNGGEPDAGRMIHVWARQAGFEVAGIQNSVTSWCHSGQRAAEWAQAWSQRVVHSKFAETIKENGFATEDEVQSLSKGWIDWSTKEDLWFSIPSGEMLYRVPS